jgi:hypothetical protein
VTATPTAPPAAIPIAPPPPPALPIEVKTPAGNTIKVLGDIERDFYVGKAKHYTDENEFTNASDLLDLDRLLFYELQIFRTTYWLAQDFDYDGFKIDPQRLQRTLKETAEQLSKVKNDLGLTKSARDKAQAEDVGTYIRELKQRAMEFGVHRETQLGKGIELCKQLFSIVGAFERADAVERAKLGFEDADAIVEWISQTMKPEFDAVDEYFRKNQQKYWVRKI